MATLAEKLIKTSPREKSGSLSANRFDFQKDWIVCFILDLHLSDQEYLVLCDYFDDVVLIDQEDTSCTSISFFQIKTRKGSTKWTYKKLITRKKNKDKKLLYSHLGKLYSNYIHFPGETKSLNFVSNQDFNLTLSNKKKSNSLTKIKCSDLDEHVITLINKSLADELNVDCNLQHRPELFFEVTSLSLLDHENHTKGRVTDFLSNYISGERYPVEPFYKTLFDEVRRKTSSEEDPSMIKDIAELKKTKGIGKSLISAMLDSIKNVPDMDKLWTDASQRLVAEDVSFIITTKIGYCWKKYEVDRMNTTNDSLQRIRTEIKKCCIQLADDNPEIKALELMNEVLQRVQQLDDSETFSPEYIKAMTLMESMIYNDNI